MAERRADGYAFAAGLDDLPDVGDINTADGCDGQRDFGGDLFQEFRPHDWPGVFGIGVEHRSEADVVGAFLYGGAGLCEAVRATPHDCPGAQQSPRFGNGQVVLAQVHSVGPHELCRGGR